MFESIVRQLCEHLDVRPPPCIAAWEVNRKARIALQSGPMSPQHCFGNILDMFPKPVVKKMFKVQRVLSSEYRAMLRAGRINNQHLMQTKGDEMLTAFDGLLSGRPLATSSWCHTHQKVCTIPISTSEGFTMHAAGTTCVDFSARSTTRMRVLGQHMVPFTVWAWTRRLHQEQVILHECVVHHPSSALLKRYLRATISSNFKLTSCSKSGSGIHSNSVSRSRILNNIHTFFVEATHIIFSFIVCPSVSGNPHTRRRRLSLALHRLHFHAPLCRQPEVFFHFDMVASGNIYFSAAMFELDCYLTAMGVTTFHELLPKGYKRRQSLNHSSRVIVSRVCSYVFGHCIHNCEAC